MKTYRYIMMTAAAVAALASCAKQENAGLSVSDSSVISFSTYEGRVQTKGDANTDAFSVAAWYGSKDDAFMESNPVVWDTDHWKTSTDYYWPLTLTEGLKFYAVMPSTLTAGKTVTVSSIAGTEDVRTAYTNVTEKPGNGRLSLTFSHDLAKVKFSLIGANTGSNIKYKVSKVELTAKNGGTIDVATRVWTPGSTDGTYTVFSDSTTPTEVTGSTAVELSTAFNLVPNQSVTVKVTYDVYQVASSTDVMIASNTKSATLDLTDGSTAHKASGTQTLYKLTLPVGADELTVSSTITPWDATTEETIDFTPLCFTANTAGSTISMIRYNGQSERNFSYSTDGTTWMTFTPGTTTITLSKVGDKVYFKGNNPDGVCESLKNHYEFRMTGSIAASGNIMSLIDNGASTCTVIPCDYCFNGLFYDCTSLTTAPALPATTLTKGCYSIMFQKCTSLTTAPALPATAMAESCYFQMFASCSSLITAPALPATTLAKSCYYLMFYNCTSLTTAPALPAMTLAESCYLGMFYGCTSLTTAPALPATTLATSCYQQMFLKSGLTTPPPELPATTLASSCYYFMFEWTQITQIPKLAAATTLATGCYKGMFDDIKTLNVSSTQTGEYQYAWTAPSSTYTSGMFGTDDSQSEWAKLDGENFPNSGTPTEGTTYYFKTIN